MRSVIVIGAGIAGLTAAWRLANEGRDVLLLEASERPGGTIQTHNRDGITFERGPQSFRSGANYSLRLIENVGLRYAILPAQDSAKTPFILWKNGLNAVPKALTNRAFFPLTALLRAAAEPFLADDPPEGDESVFDFFARRLGHHVASRIADPLVAGIFGGDPRELSIQAAFPDLARAERNGRSLIGSALTARWTQPARLPWAPKTLFSLRYGLEALPLRIAQLLGHRLRLSSPVEEIQHINGGFRVIAPGGPYEAASVVVAAPPHQAAAFSPVGRDELAAFPRASMASVLIGWPSEEVPEPIDGFGWLAPSTLRKDVLGVIAVSKCFPVHSPGITLLRVMIGGSRDPGHPRDPEELVLRARQVVESVHSIRAAPSFSDVAIHGIPQYRLGHIERLRSLQAALPGLRWLGWGYSGIGLEHGVRAAQDLVI